MPYMVNKKSSKSTKEMATDQKGVEATDCRIHSLCTIMRVSFLFLKNKKPQKPTLNQKLDLT